MQDAWLIAMDGLLQNLYNLQNYHSASAIMHGLHTANPALFDMSQYPIMPSLVLLDSSDNYGAYRKVMRQSRGLPFLLPHIRDYMLRGQEALRDVFPFPSQ
jgi:hypothetical protein